MNPKKTYKISVFFFSALLISIIFLTAYSFQETNAINYQHTLADNITVNLTKMLFFLTDYSFYAIQNNSFSAIRATQWLAPSFNLQGNMTRLISSNPSEKLLINQMQDSFLKLLPLMGLLSTEGISESQILSTWNSLFSQINNFLTITANLTNTLNNQLSDLFQNLLSILLSFIITLVVFLFFIYFQIFGRTIKTTEKLEEKGHTLEITNESLEKLVMERTKQLNDSERMAAIGQTAGMVGHDIRNPLQAIASDVYILQSDLDAIPEIKTRDEVKESLASIEMNVTYINKIVADLQDYARPLKPEYSEIDLSDLIRTVFTAIQVPDKITISIDIKAGLKLRTDPTFVRRALTNLINNAIQAMPNGGQLEVIGYPREKRVFISVSDTGMGIPEEVKTKLFTPMTTTKSKGHGLGLAVVKRLVEAMHGSIYFESEKGKGTKFTITLPLDQ